MPEKLIQILLGVRIVLDASNVFRAASRLFSTAYLSHTPLTHAAALCFVSTALLHFFLRSSLLNNPNQSFRP